MEQKLAAYICTGCGIGDALDIEQLSKVATKDCKVPICRSHPNLCSQEGAELIKEDMANEGVNTVVIAACSPRVMYDVFNFENSIVDRVNLREQVVWCQKPNDEDTQMMAEDYLRMSVAKVKKMELPEPYKPEQEISKDLLVVGGGLTGLTAALEAANAGRNVVLVEKQAELGGFQKKVAQKITFPYKSVKNNDIQDLIQAVKQNQKITVYTSAKVAKTSGGPGVFDVQISQNGSTLQHSVGAIIQAAGWQPYDPTKLDENLGFGESPNVITNVMFEEIAAKGAITRPGDGKEPGSVAFLQCAGQRDPNHLPYCSSVCCLTALKQAIQIKEQNPNAHVYVIYKEMRTPGQAEDFYRKAQEAGVLFIRCQSPEVQVNGDRISVEAQDELLGEKLLLENLDMVVLATGMVPESAFGEDFRAKAKVKGKTGGRRKCRPMRFWYRIFSTWNTGRVRSSPGLPTASPIPISSASPMKAAAPEFMRPDAYGVRWEPPSAAEDAAGAAMKAIQCIELTSQGAAVHPRAGDFTFPEFFMQRCTQCKRCTEECPFGAINEDEKGNPLPQPTRCRRCGVCMGACPERIISFKNYSVAMIGDMIKSIEVPEEDEEKPRIVVLACENDAYPALDMVGLRHSNYNPWVRVIPMRCLGSLNLVFIADALSKGIDGVLLLGCQHGENYQCHFVKGSELANIRLSKVKETLDRLKLESDRVRFENTSICDYDRLPAFLDEFAERLVEIGPNPYKGF